MVSYDLPQEILVDIFLRLPAKSIGKCRCLSKQWLTLLSTPEFIKSHLTRGPHQENLILIDLYDHSIYTITSITSIKEDTYCRKLNLPYEGHRVLGSCDGLILLLTQQSKMVLVNPITLQHVEIPEKPEATDSHLDLEADENFSMHAFGYDRFNDDYKVVTLSHYAHKEDYVAYPRALVYVYSVKRGVWKRVGISPNSSSLSEASCGAFVNDAIHWLVHGEEGGHWLAIAGFNLVDEVFYLIPAPNGLENKEFNYNEVGILGGCVCLTDCGINDSERNDRIDVWVMKEYGVEESWTKLSIVGDYSKLQPLCFIGDDEFLLLISFGGLVVYNQKERTLRDLFELVVSGAPTTLSHGGSFVQSLVSPALNGTELRLVELQ